MMEVFVLLVAVVTLAYVIVVFRFLDQPETQVHPWSAEYRKGYPGPGTGPGITTGQRDGVAQASVPGRVVDDVIGAKPASSRVLSTVSQASMLSCPTLCVIDWALGPTHAPFATDPAAATLEQRARDLADRYWSEIVWLTGHIDEAKLAVVSAALERERAAMRSLEDSVSAA